jgi:hypothetical protein
MRTLRRTLSIIGIATLLSSFGCATRTVIVVDRNDDIVRLGPNVVGSVSVYRNGEWQEAGKMKLPEGWYAGPGPKDLTH